MPAKAAELVRTAQQALMTAAEVVEESVAVEETAASGG
jgi:hypothetical protein